jgi:hypothetical protein
MMPASRPLDWSSRAREAHWRLTFAPGHKTRHQLKRVRPQGAGNCDKFHNVKSAFAAFIFGDKRLRLFQAKGEGVLGQPGGLARANHERAKGGMVGRMDGFADTAGARCHQPGKLIPSSDYPKIG